MSNVYGWGQEVCKITHWIIVVSNFFLSLNIQGNALFIFNVQIVIEAYVCATYVMLCKIQAEVLKFYDIDSWAHFLLLSWLHLLQVIIGKTVLVKIRV